VRASTALALKPTGMSFEAAAAVCDGAMQALSALRQAGAGAGRRIAIYGAYDAIIDAVGKYSFLRGRPALKPGGIYVATDGGRFLVGTLFLAVGARFVGSKRIRFAVGRRSKDDVRLLRGLIEAGEFRAVIDRSFPMDQAAEAHSYVETWRKTGNVVLTVP
jgi:NADPH:quinone reductase-like Zn-dependent oxidoreductase